MDFFSALLHPRKFNSSPLKKRWLEDDPFLLGQKVTFQGRTVKLREGKSEVPNSLCFSLVLDGYCNFFKESELNLKLTNRP